MTPEERQLITGLFDRMRNFGSVEKDRDAESLINERVRAMPDAPYMLVQSVLVQEQALQQAEARIRDLEDDLRELESSQTRAPAAGGGFLGGLFGGGRPAAQPSNTSVPPIGSRAMDAPPAGRDRPGPGGPFAGAYEAGPQAPARGGFMQSAMATAAGVAGGMLAAGAIRDLMGGGSAQASTAAGNKDNAASGTDAGNQQQASTADAGNNTQAARDEQGDKGQDTRDDNYQDAYDDSSDSWDDGGDFEV
jgi:hypothetical protein